MQFSYRSGSAEPEIVEGFAGKTLSGNGVLRGFGLSLKTMLRKT